MMAATQKRNASQRHYARERDRQPPAETLAEVLAQPTAEPAITFVESEASRLGLWISLVLPPWLAVTRETADAVQRQIQTWLDDAPPGSRFVLEKPGIGR